MALCFYWSSAAEATEVELAGIQKRDRLYCTYCEVRRVLDLMRGLHVGRSLMLKRAAIKGIKVIEGCGEGEEYLGCCNLWGNDALTGNFEEKDDGLLCLQLLDFSHKNRRENDPSIFASISSRQ